MLNLQNSILLFSFIDEGQKLKLIKYNKNFQKTLDKSIINYKLFQGKYIIYNQNKKVKECLGFNNQIAFYGEYLNGKRNGRGKEYIEDYLAFEGE